jgi:heme A synthase
VLIYNIAVVLWGALVRATGAGAGCGSHWPLCNGEVVPRSPQLTTMIEFTHRITSGLALLGVLGLLIWAYRRFPSGHRVRKYALLSLVFILVEALLGAGLVLLEYVDQNRSAGRAVYLSAHLANTQVLLAMLALTAWYARPQTAPAAAHRLRPLLAGALPVLLIVGISGAIAALGDTLFPATSFSEGVRQEMSETAHFLLRLRVFHPALAVLSAVYVSFAALKVLKARPSALVVRLAWMMWGLMAVQLVAGAVNVALLAPVWMQIVHLLLADVLWVVLVLLVVEGSRELRLRTGF